jgi:hypothetical protein
MVAQINNAIMAMLIIMAIFPVISHAQESEKCFMNSKQWIIHSGMNDTKGHEVTDWEVSCYVKDGETTVWENKIPLAHPCSLHDALRGVEYFMKVRAPQIYRDWKGKR